MVWDDVRRNWNLKMEQKKKNKREYYLSKNENEFCHYINSGYPEDVPKN